MSKDRKPLKLPPKPLPIIVVPDKTYIDNTGDVKPTDVILVADPLLYGNMQTILAAMRLEQGGTDGN